MLKPFTFLHLNCDPELAKIAAKSTTGVRIVTQTPGATRLKCRTLEQKYDYFTEYRGLRW